MATKNVSFSASKATLSMSAVIDLIVHTGMDNTILVEGDMGSGKTSLLWEVAKRTGLRPVYFDSTTKDLGDLFLPRVSDAAGGDYISMVPNEEFGIHLGTPIVLLIDEFGKNRSITNGLLRVLQEHSVGNRRLPAGSIVFATTNLGSENVGDMLMPHARNRLDIVRMLKPTFQEWLDWGAPAGINPIVLNCVRETPEMLVSFTDVEKPEDNLYIYDPRDAGRTSFVTPRSLAKASKVIDKRDVLGRETTYQGIVGLIGGKAAGVMMTMADLSDTLPKYTDIVMAPTTVKVPNMAGAQIMSTLTCMQRVTQTEFADVFKYVQRMPMEMQALFVTQLMRMSAKAQWLHRQASFTEFGMKNAALFQPGR